SLLRRRTHGYRWGRLRAGGRPDCGLCGRGGSGASRGSVLRPVHVAPISHGACGRFPASARVEGVGGRRYGGLSMRRYFFWTDAQIPELARREIAVSLRDGFMPGPSVRGRGQGALRLGYGIGSTSGGPGETAEPDFSTRIAPGPARTGCWPG